MPAPRRAAGGGPQVHGRLLLPVHVRPGLAGLGLGMLASGEDSGARACLSDPEGRRHIRITSMCRPAAGSVLLGVVTTVGLGGTVTGDGPASHLDQFCPAALDAKRRATSASASS